MNKRQRAQVVELLRCTFDDGQNFNASGIYHIASELGLLGTGHANLNIWRQAKDARTAVFEELLWMNYFDECLEAAARVEEGSWP